MLSPVQYGSGSWTTPKFVKNLKLERSVELDSAGKALSKTDCASGAGGRERAARL